MAWGVPLVKLAIVDCQHRQRELQELKVSLFSIVGEDLIIESKSIDILRLQWKCTLYPGTVLIWPLPSVIGTNQAMIFLNEARSFG